MDRRRFCIASASTAICLAAQRADSAQSDPLEPPIALEKVLFDSRHPAARAFGAAAAGAGWAALAFAGDVTAMWRHTLLPWWSAGGGAIAGMTTAAGLFCLEQLAKDHWMRVVLRVEHRRPLPGILEHGVTAPLPALTRACAMLTDKPDWPARTFGLLRGCERARNQPRVRRVVCSEDRGPYGVADADLVSWIIAA